MAEKKNANPPGRAGEYELFGASLTPQGREAEWQAYLAGMPHKGLGCPPESDLIDLGRGVLLPGRTEEIEGHLRGCEYCRGVVAYCRQPARLEGSLLQDVSASLMRGRLLADAGAPVAEVP